eukprot:CAMPEP_0176004040 /NCGR_PEP_ID=MMETSP0120_2-20121206/1485_1 /TAXON_ID=160619 /ORGANISM="Kryptoperidinium foliaceum, Strain CCMP 1326" /LENGTH=846 /DNA_ID=CAMNT_0017336703 /DNA_START=1 /DNA_END=2539 /DNA_ORIENTATION=-
MECSEPTVPNAWALPSGEARPCVESDASGLYKHNATCSARCQDGFIPTVNALVCVGGSFQPATFVCAQPATSPNIFPSAGGATTATVQWTAGAPNGCEFSAWQLEFRNHGSATTTLWQAAVNCANLVSRLLGADLTAGATYEYRIRETCRDARFNSAWTVSGPVAQVSVAAPNVLSNMPAAGEMSFTPFDIVVVYQNPVRIGSSGTFTARRSGLLNECPDAELSLSTADISTTAPTLPETGGLTNNNVLTVKPPTGFFFPGCRFSFTISPGFVVANDVVPTPSPLYEWTSDYVANQPVLQKLLLTNVEVTTHGIRAKFETRYDLTTKFSCDVLALQPEQQPLLAGPRPAAYPTGLTWGPQWQTVLPSSVGPIAQTLNGQTMSFTFDGLVPGKDYTIGCGGTSLGQSWVRTKCEGVAGSTCEPKPFTTPADTVADIVQVEVRKFALCKDGRELLLGDPVILPPDSLSSGETIKLSEYEEACDEMVFVGGKVRVAARINVTMVSKYAYVKFPRLDGWEAAMTIAKAFGGGNTSSTEELTFDACPHSSIAGTTPCVPHAVPITATDVQVAIDDIFIGGFPMFAAQSAGNGNGNGIGNGIGVGVGRRLAGGQERSRFEVEVGQLVTLAMRLDPSVDPTLLSVWLGPRERGFLQNVTVTPDGSLQFFADGIGRNLPLYIIWEGVSFHTIISLSFKWPKILLHPIRSGELGREWLLANITEGAPNRTGHTTSMHMTMRLSVSKRLEGMPSPGLCVGDQSYLRGWSQVQCSVAMVFLEEVSAFLEVMDFESGKWVFAEGTEHFDVIQYKKPVLSGIWWKGQANGSMSLVDLSNVRPPNFTDSNAAVVALPAVP